MKPQKLQQAGLFILALVFSTGLMFAFTEGPRLLDGLVQKVIHTPQSDPAYDPLMADLFISSYAIRWIGYASLAVILSMIILGFSIRKPGWAWVGSIALFLPVFATFANSMFYLAGLGLFNVILFPFLDISLDLTHLGDIALVPYQVLVWFFGLFHWDAHRFLVWFFMGSGAFIFVLGVFTWMKSRYSGREVAKGWLYRYSRHPQYLGWIIWSYGLMLYGPSLPQMKKSWGWAGTLPWLLGTMVILGICLLEESRMKERAGEEYEAYRRRVPFLFPLPRILKAVLRAPVRWLTRKDRPETGREILLVTGFYTILLIGFSLVRFLPAGSSGPGPVTTPMVTTARIDSLVKEIERPQPRRYRDKPVNELASLGAPAYPALLDLIGSEDPVVREFAIVAATRHQVRESAPYLIHALYDPVARVSRMAIQGLGGLKIPETADTLMSLLENPPPTISQNQLIQALTDLGCRSVQPYLEQALNDSLWYHRRGVLQSMVRLDPVAARPFLYASLKDPDENVRQKAAALILETLPPDALPYLEKALEDECWEVRFIARQAMKQLKESQARRPLLEVPVFRAW